MPGISREKFGPSAIAWYLFCASLFVLALGAQLDFATEKNEAVSKYVPKPFLGMAHVAKAERAIQSEAPAESLSAAKELIQARPVQAESLTKLARAAILNENELLASEALIAAASRGWRDPVAQIAILEGAIAVSDWTVVAQRLSAVRKLRYPRELTDSRLALVAEHEMGRQELVRQLASDPFFLQQFASYGPSILPPQRFVELLEGATAQSKSSEKCAVIRDGTQALLEANAGMAAYGLWKPDCADRGEEAHDFAFGPVSPGEAASPFAWEYPTSPGLSRRAVAQNDRFVVNYSNSSNLERRVAVKLSALRPGSYTLSIDVESASTDVVAQAAKVEPVVFCRELQRPVRVRRLEAYSWSFDVPAENCDVQRISLEVGRGKGLLSNVSVR